MNVVSDLIRVMGNPAVIGLMAYQGVAAGGLERQIQSLDGEWEIIFDDTNEGHELSWGKEEVFYRLNDMRVWPDSFQILELQFALARYTNTLNWLSII